MKSDSKKTLFIISVAAACVVVALASVAFVRLVRDSRENQDAEENNGASVSGLEPEATDRAVIPDPVVELRDGEFRFLSGGFDSMADVDGRQEGRVLVYRSLEDDEPVYYTPDWQLDSYDVSADGRTAVYGTFHTKEKIYRVYRYDADEHQNTVLAQFDLSSSALFTVDHVHLPLTALALSPDAAHYYLESFDFDRKYYVGLTYNNFVQATEGGEIVPLDIPSDIYQQYWFSNDEVAFSGANFAGSGYEQDFVQIFNIDTRQVSSTKIPARGAMSGLSPKVNPGATAYASYDIVSNSGYACGGNIMSLVVRSYPDGAEVYRLDRLHKLDYRWLPNNTLKIVYTPVPTTEAPYLPKSNMSAEDMGAITCADEDVTYYAAP